jgi:CubicO group peptidase (beta-lactamase class C family)
MDVLGAVIARVHGGTLADAVAEYVTGPLGMRETSFRAPDTKRLATVYADAKPEPKRMGEPERVPRPEDPGTTIIFSPARAFDERSFQSGGAGLNGSAADYLTFLEAIRRDGGKLLKPATVAMASQNQIGTIPRPAGDVGLRSGFFGNIVADPKAAGVPLSPGTLTGGGAWGHKWYIDRARKLSIVALTNTAMEGVAGDYPAALRKAIYGAIA